MSGKILDSAFLDAMDTLDLYLQDAPTAIHLLLPDGTESEVTWQETADHIYSVDVRVEPLYPVILLIRS